MKNLLLIFLSVCSANYASAQDCYLATNRVEDGIVHKISAKRLIKDSEKELRIQTTRLGNEYTVEVVYRQFLRYGTPVNMTVDGTKHALIFTLASSDNCTLNSLKPETVRSKTVGREFIEYVNTYSLPEKEVRLLSKSPVRSVMIQCYGVKKGFNTDDVLLKVEKEYADNFLHDIECVGEYVAIESSLDMRNEVNVDQARYLEVVTLKDGTIIRGVIVEQIPGKAIKIKTAEGNQYTYEASEIAGIVKEENNRNLVETRANPIMKRPSELSNKKEGTHVTETYRPSEEPRKSGVVEVSNAEQSETKVSPATEQERVRSVAQEQPMKTVAPAKQEVIGKDVLTNEKIIQLTQRGMAPSVIVAMIQGGQTKFDNGYNAILELNDKKVNADVITLMMEKSAESVERQVAQVNLKDPNAMQDPGIYLCHKNDSETPIEKLIPSMVGGTKSGGGGYGGFSSSSSWAKIAGLNSLVQISEELPEFNFYFDPTNLYRQDGFGGDSNPKNFVLVKLRSEDGARLFKVGGGSSAMFGGSSSSGIPPEFIIQHKIVTVSKGIYKVTPIDSIKGGEYGFICLRDMDQVYDFGKPREPKRKGRRRN